MAALPEAPAPPSDAGVELLARFIDNRSRPHGTGGFDAWDSAADVLMPSRGSEFDTLAVLEELYPEFAADAAIVRLAARDRDLLSVLVELPGAAARAFGPRTTVTLEHFRDRDSVGAEQIVAVLDVPLPRAERRRLLRHFDRSWWLARTRRVGPRMFLDVR